MPAKKRSKKLDDMMKGAGSATGNVFNGSLFGNDSLLKEQQKGAEEDFRYMIVSIDSIDFDDVEYPFILEDSIANGRIVQPVLLRESYEEKERAGRKFKAKTGRYTIIDGRKRATIARKLWNESSEKQDTKTMQKFQNIPALVVPLGTSDEECQRLKEESNTNKETSTKSILNDITETKKQEITYCYQYEMAEIPVEKIVERDVNQFYSTQSEVDALEQSIYRVGLIQPLSVLPVLDSKTMDVNYEIQAGHKRFTAIRQLIRHSEDSKFAFENGEKIDRNIVKKSFSTITCLVIPMGAQAEKVEQIYQDSNILARHMEASDMFEHMNYFDNMPSRPETKPEFVEFKSKNYSIRALVRQMQENLKKLGFHDWKRTRCNEFLNVYYFGCKKALEIYKDPTAYGLLKKDIVWIVTQNKDFNERKKQEQILAKAIIDKSTLTDLMNENKSKRNNTLTISSIKNHVLKQRDAIKGMIESPVEDATAQELKETRYILKQTIKSLQELEKKIEGMPAKE